MKQAATLLRLLVGAASLLPAVTIGPLASARAEPPSASFVWSPPAPLSGEQVSLASTATDSSSSITGWAWDLLGNGPLQAGGPVVTTSFTTPGNHVVRLLVSAADGSMSQVAETIFVRPVPLAEMLPFPIVRIVSIALATGARLRLLAIEAPPGARTSIECRGRGCPVRLQAQTTASPGSESITSSFPRFERFLRAGITLQIRVAKAGEVGKYTRITIRRRRPPARHDACLDPSLPTPVSCPPAQRGP
jgi:hypothetical protein